MMEEAAGLSLGFWVLSTGLLETSFETLGKCVRIAEWGWEGSSPPLLTY